jgi:hypothetical protein
MRMELFAEGVETFEQVKYLRERGIFLAQGYNFAPPLPGALFRQLLEAANPLGNGATAGSTATAVSDFMAARDRLRRHDTTGVNQALTMLGRHPGPPAPSMAGARGQP